MYFNVNFNVFFKLIKVHLLVSELDEKVLFYTYEIKMITCVRNSHETWFWNSCTLQHNEEKKKRV